MKYIGAYFQSVRDLDTVALFKKYSQAESARFGFENPPESRCP